MSKLIYRLHQQGINHVEQRVAFWLTLHEDGKIDVQRPNEQDVPLNEIFGDEAKLFRLSWECAAEKGDWSDELHMELIADEIEQSMDRLLPRDKKMNVCYFEYHRYPHDPS